ncbi:glycosyltransferase family 2 protein [Erythrobacter sp. W53]|uniref:glycosyltransferase family 2 protein n=1 Tax=Erythrobacter sp. W53 TaxID=3425947 RepID=UPI003D766F2C
MACPEVTIITPCYNAEQYLQQCIESVQSQRFRNWEHLIVDDQSNDRSREIIEGYQARDNRVALLISSDKLGASKARNLAIANAKGKYIAFLDADDWWSSDKLALQIIEMKSADAKFSCSAYNIVDEAGSVLRVQNIESLNQHLLLTKQAVIGCLTVLYDKAYFEQFRFSENMLAAEDYEMWCRMLIHLKKDGGKSAVISEPLAYYRVHSGGKSHKKLRRIKVHYNIYRNHLRLPFVYATWCTLSYVVNGIRDRMLHRSCK